jgi:peptide/nickel transport system substrate-binding protein
MREGMRLVVLGALLCLSAFAAASCGGSGVVDGEARRGGSITIAQSSQPDALDPALSYVADVWEALWLVYTPLLTYKRVESEEGTELMPGLARDLPEISQDGRTYRLKLRKGLRYSDGRPVRASDFEHTIKRVLTLESGGTSFYLGIEGAQRYVQGGKPEANITGIESDDGTGEITIRLTAPDGTFPNVLAMNFSGLVPSDTPFENMTKDPPPGVGPYKLTKSVPNREFVLERNERFDLPGIPKGRLARITTKIVKSRTRATQDVIDGRLDYMVQSPATDLLPEIKQRYRDRYETHFTASTFYFFLNHRTPPFDDRRVREAVNYALDKPALARLRGGEFQTACNFLPPNTPGYQKLEPCPWGDPDEPPDIGKARRLIRQAGAEGSRVDVWGDTEQPGKGLIVAYTDMLNRIGLDAREKLVDGGVLFQTLGNQKTGAQTGFASWIPDFPHPYNFLFQMSGESIQETNNQNLSNVDDPELTTDIERLRKEPELEKVGDEWAAVDRKLVERAHIAPYGHDLAFTFMSERMDIEHCSRFHPLYLNDYSSFCLK